MRALLTLSLASLLLPSCASVMQWERREVNRAPLNYRPLATTPAEVDAYLKRNVPRKTLKKWDAHVSDDTVIVQGVDSSGNTFEGLAR